MKYLKTEHNYREMEKWGKMHLVEIQPALRVKTLHLGEEIFGNLFSENSGNYER